MNVRTRLIALSLLAASLPATAFAQATDESMRLRLTLGPDGRVELSTQNEIDTLAIGAPATLSFDNQRLHRHAIDLTASAVSDAASTACAQDALLRLGPMTACDWLTPGYEGLPGAVQGLDIGLRLGDVGQRYGLDFRYGLGWLDSSTLHDHAVPGGWLLNGFDASGNAARSSTPWYGTPMSPLNLERIALGGFVGLGGDLRLHLGYEHAEGPLALFPSGAGGSWATGNQNSISLGIGYGRFYGGLTGRQLRPSDPMLDQQGATNSLDLGFSWRMPWRGELEFGARNLITTPSKPENPERAAQQGDLRVPYVRYHQEL